MTYVSPLVAFKLGLIFLFSTFVWSVCLAIKVLVRPWSRRLYRRFIVLFCESKWVDSIGLLFPTTDLHVSGDTIDAAGMKLLCANHQLDADWWYLWEVAKLSDQHGRVKIILKNSLKDIPIVGWGMQAFEFMFLHRKWEHDEKTIRDHLASFAEDQFPVIMLIFPEGTTMHTEALDKCHKFAQQENRPTFKRCLLPRVTGFKACLEAMDSRKPAVYDATIAFEGYKGEVPTYEMGWDRKVDVNMPNLFKMLAGVPPGSVHIHIDRYDYETVAADPQKWLDERWQRKDQRMEHFIEHGRFDDTDRERVKVTNPQGSWVSMLFSAAVLVSMVYFWRWELYFLIPYTVLVVFFKALFELVPALQTVAVPFGAFSIGLSIALVCYVTSLAPRQ